MNYKLPNIIFLDVDGVLVNPETCIAEDDKCGYSYFDPISARLVRRLCEEHNCRIVISSSWRKLLNAESMKAILGAVCPRLGHYMYTDDRWCTISPTNGYRGEEIKAWIDKYSSQFNSFVILDDDSDMEPFMDNFVHTDAYRGFRLEDFIKADKILRQE